MGWCLYGMVQKVTAKKNVGMFIDMKVEYSYECIFVRNIKAYIKIHLRPSKKKLNHWHQTGRINIGRQRPSCTPAQPRIIRSQSHTNPVPHSHFGLSVISDAHS